MDYLSKLTKALNYIETNLFDPKLIQNVHKEVYISKYHFHRIFLIGTKFTLGEYIRRRRFTEIEKKLINKKNKIIDIAFYCNYNSHEAFSRAFKSYFGLSPSAYISNPTRNPLLLQNPIMTNELEFSSKLMIITPDITFIEDLKLSGIKGTTSFSDNNIKKLWDRFNTYIKKNNLNDENESGYTIWLSEEENSKKINNDKEYNIAVAIRSKNNRDNNLELYTIQNSKYACFKVIGNFNYLYKIYSYIYFSWLNKSNYVLADGLIFEEYSNDFSIEKGQGEMNIFIPIEKQ